MKQSLLIILSYVLFIGNSFSQASDIEKFIDEGITLHDKGDYMGAIEKFNKAIVIDKNSTLANYEISNTYFALKDYEKAIQYSDQVISMKKEYLEGAYVIKGSAQDLNGNTKEAIRTYEMAIKEFPKSHLLYYNLAFTSYNVKEYSKAELALQNSIKLKPLHTSSHLLLGYLMSDQGYRVKSLLALYNFLLLEPKGNRTKGAFKLLQYELKKGVTKENDSSINILVSNSKDSDEFSAAELMLSLLEASKNLEDNKNKTEYELFAENTKSFFSVLDQLSKDKKGFWWNNYVNLFSSMNNNDHVEAFSYYISQSRDDVNITTWLNSNKDKVESLSRWFSNYKREF